MPNTLDVSTLHERPAARRPTRAHEAHHDNATFASLAPPYAGVGESRAGWEGYHAVHWALSAYHHGQEGIARDVNTPCRRQHPPVAGPLLNTGAWPRCYCALSSSLPPALYVAGSLSSKACHLSC